MSIQYSCSHLEDPHPPLPPSYPSSSTNYDPLPNLYFCEECDAIRCNLCAGVEIASYFCPNCLFDVPSANVRADRNRLAQCPSSGDGGHQLMKGIRCARNCFSCPSCESSLAVQATERVGESGAVEAGAPYVLSCPGCRWSSRQIGWEFEKPTSLAGESFSSSYRMTSPDLGLSAQVQRLNTQTETVQAEYEAIKDHLESYMTSSATATTPAPKGGKSKNPSRHISHLKQMAAKALGREVPGMMSRPRRKEGLEKGKEKAGWDELADFEAKRSWKEPVDLGQDASVERANLELAWARSWAGEVHNMAK